MKNARTIVALITGLCICRDMSAQINRPALTISYLMDDFYIYTTYNMVNGQSFPSNSIYLVSDSGVVMFDTPWDTSQFKPLLDSIESKHHQKVVLCIATHYHDDRTGAFEFLKKQGVRTYSSKKTYDLCRQFKMSQADSYFTKDTGFTLGRHVFQTYYGGEGHTKDNIVIWFEKEKILYGGCLIKSVESTNLGYTKEANLAEWPATLKKVKGKFPDPKYIIPGHQSWISTKSIAHTLQLLQANKKNPDK